MNGRGQAPDIRSEAFDAQRTAVQRSQGSTQQNNVATLLIFGVMLLLVPGAWGAAGGGEARRSPVIAGVVRDSQGVAQMGALVQVLAANSVTVATAFTDQHGRYAITNLSPGKYLVRASATLYVPATRANLEIRTGITSVVNLTLAALFDTASWLPAERRRADESDDDWKWTLRSTANRPILRIVEDGSLIEVSSSAAESKAAVKTQARGAVESGDGEFGQGGVHTILSLRNSLDDGSEMTLRANLGSAAQPGRSTNGGPVTSAAGTELAAGYEGKTGFDGGAARMLMTFKSHPELISVGSIPGSGAGLQVTQMTSAQRLSLGERVEVEAGGMMEAVHTTETAFAARPFLRVSAHPAGAWTLEYRLATDRSLQNFGDVTDGDGDIPVALVQNGRLTIESGHHQEISVGRVEDRGTVQVAFYHDDFAERVVSGGQGAGAPEAGTPSESASGMPPQLILDPTSGTFRAFGSGYAGNGARITASSPLTPSLWVAAELSTGDALESPYDPSVPEPVGFKQALNELQVRRSTTATIALKGKLLGTGTRVRASYRYQPERGVTAVDPYSAFGDQAYLSCLVRQPIHWTGHLPEGLDATIDVTNLLAQGYRPFLSADGQTLYFAQAPRTIQAGVSFSF